MIRVRYHEAAEEEALSEIGYLEQQAKGLGRRFYADMQQAEGRIAQFPEAGTEIAPGIRKWSFRQFRYWLIYAREADGVLILAVAHQSRRPGYWTARAAGER